MSKVSYLKISSQAMTFGSLLFLFVFSIAVVRAQEVPPTEEVPVVETPVVTDPVVPPADPVTPPVEPVVEPVPTEPTPTTEPVEPAPVVDPTPVVDPAPAPDPEPTPEEITPSESTDLSADFEKYQKYQLYLKYEKRDYYKKYLRHRELAGKYPWENKKAEKKALKKLKRDAKKYRKSPSKYPHLRTRAEDYANYASLKAEYFATKPYASYVNYVLYDKDSYAAYKEYGTEENKQGYLRYEQAIKDGRVALPDEPKEESSALGPEITVGIFNYIPQDLRTASFSISANTPFRVLDNDGKVKGEIPAETKVRVKYLGDKRFIVYYSSNNQEIAILSKEVRFSAASEYKDVVVFDVSRPGSSFDRFRGSIRLRHYDSPEADGDRIWVINKLPLEHYVWGMGEITGTGPESYNQVMTTIFRTYGYWKIQWSTKYAAQGFKVDATSGSQIYYGYDWEITHDRIKTAALVSRGTLVFYDGEVALTPYSSWTDGKTRRYEDGHWGHKCVDDKKKTSTIYPWLSSVSDSYGKNPDLSKCELASRGNHMVGLSANGAVRMARDGGKDYLSILRHYYSGISLDKRY